MKKTPLTDRQGGQTGQFGRRCPVKPEQRQRQFLMQCCDSARVRQRISTLMGSGFSAKNKDADPSDGDQCEAYLNWNAAMHWDIRIEHFIRVLNPML